MTVRSGRMRDRAEFQVRAEAKDQYGNERTEWRQYAVRFGAIMESAPPDPPLVGGALQPQARARLTVRLDGPMTRLPDRARVRVRDRWWNVTGRWQRMGERAAERQFLIFGLEAQQ